MVFQLCDLMNISLSQHKPVIYSIVFLILTTIFSYLFCRYQLVGTFDAIYTAGFPLTFYYTGGFVNIHQFLLLPFLLDLAVALTIVFVVSKIYKKLQQNRS